MQKKLQLYKLLSIVILYCVISQGCKKFLDAKPSTNLAVPETLDDLQALLDDPTQMNRADPIASEISCDNYFMTQTDYEHPTVTIYLQNTYKWNKDFQFPPNSATNEWAQCYNQVYRANLVLHQLSEIERTAANGEQWDNVKGQALMLRGRIFLLTATIWTLSYDSTTSGTDLGLPLRLDPDFNLPSVRSTLQQTYDRIIADLKESVVLLPDVPRAISRASKPAAYAFLARTYLAMRKYDSALLYADKSLQLKSDLKNYNDANVSKTNNATFAFSSVSSASPNPEIIFAARSTIPSPLNTGRSRIDTILYDSYNTNDLRKTVFFFTQLGSPRTVRYKGSYDGSAMPFTGIATDEVYFIRAECYARFGNKNAALKDLDTLMAKRWKNTVTYPGITASDATEALNKILIERRKELLYRGIRWMDLKRFNKEGANITLARVIDQGYTLPPNDLRYALAIPEDVISISGMPQNPRQ